MAGKPARVWLADYAPPPYVVEFIEMSVQLDEQRTVISCSQTLVRGSLPPGADLVLGGHGFQLVSLEIDGAAPASGSYSIRDGDRDDLNSGIPGHACALAVPDTHIPIQTRDLRPTLDESVLCDGFDLWS